MRRMTQRLLAFGLLPALSCQALGQFAGPVDPAGTHTIPEFTIPPERPGVVYERFIVIGDMGSGKPGQKRVASAMAQRASEQPIDLVLTVGDNIYPDGVTSADDPQWQTKFEAVYSDSALAVPFYATLGNHDHRGNPQAQIDYAHKSERWRMPDRYYTFTRPLGDGAEVQFFAIDSDPIYREHQSAAAQVQWLDDQLGQSDAEWKIVFGHHPLYGHNPKRGNFPSMIETLEPAFVEHRCDVYFAGHDHTLEMLKPVKGVHYVISGAGGGPEWAYAVNWTDESYYAATLGGFVLCRISKDELVIEFVRLDGQTQYAHTLRK